MEISKRFTGRSYDEFISHLKRKSPRTQAIYARALEKFLDHYDLDTERLYQMFIENLRSEDKRDKSKVGNMVNDYMLELQGKGYAGNYVLEIKKSVNFFFTSNSETVFYTDSSVIDRSTNGKDRINKEQIITVLDVMGSIRDKSIVTMLKDTGARVSDLANIRVKHIIDAVRENREFHTFEIEIKKTGKKTGIKGNFVFGPDAFRYLKMWWVDRRRYGCSEDPEAPLYCMVLEPNKGEPMGSHLITAMLYKFLEKANIKGREKLSAHSLRKNFETSMQSGGVPDRIIDKMTGRAEGYKGTYVRPDPEELLGFYKRAYAHLSLSPNGGVTVQVKEQSREIDDLKRTLADYEEDALESAKLINKQSDLLKKMQLALIKAGIIKNEE